MSQVNTKTVLLGSNADQSKNFRITVPTPEDGTLTIERADGTDVMVVAADGKVSFPGNIVPAFSVKKSTTQTLVSGTGATILFDAEGFDTSNAYDPATGRFTPQVAGYYQVNADVALNTNAAGTAGQVSIQKNGTSVAQEIGGYTATSVSLYGQFAVGTLVYMNGTTDYLNVVAAVTATNPFVATGSFSAALVRVA